MSLANAIRRTFENRDTEVIVAPVALTPAFARDEGKARQWQAFVRKLWLAGVPDELETVVSKVAEFLRPIAESPVAKADPPRRWKAAGP